MARQKQHQTARLRPLLRSLCCAPLLSAYSNSYSFFVALRTITTLPFAPGTAPRIISRLFSASTRATVRPLFVIRASPMWPDERFPLITRDGYAEAPIEPGARTFIEPCDSGPRLK